MAGVGRMACLTLMMTLGVGCANVEQSNIRLREQGASALERGRYDEAVQAYGTVLERKPEDPVANHGMGLALLQSGEPTRAIQYLHVAYQNVWDRSERGYVVAGDLAEAYAQAGEIDLLASFLRSRAESTGEARDYVRWGEYMAAQGDPDTAEKAYLIALDVSPESPEAYYQLGRLYEGVGRTDEAIRRFRQAYGLTPGDARVIEKIEQYLGVPGPTVSLPPGR